MHVAFMQNHPLLDEVLTFYCDTEDKFLQAKVQYTYEWYFLFLTLLHELQVWKSSFSYSTLAGNKKHFMPPVGT